MIERHLASPAPTFGTQYGHPGPVYNEYTGEYTDNGAGYGAPNYQSFTPGQVINMNNGAPSPISANAVHPMYANPAYAQSPFAPAGLPIAQYAGDQEYHEQGQPSGGVAAYPVLTRQGSGSSFSEHARLPSPTGIQRENAPANDYVDLSRSSVSPYQAQQYQEISRRLNTEVPPGLPTAEIEKDLPLQPSTSPFADPDSAPPPSPGGQYAIDRRNLERPISGESLASQTLEFPVPPSPAHTVTSRYRVDSTPPTLPEILVESRESIGGYPMLRNSELSPGLTPGQGSRFPTTPSPLASSFAMPSTPTAEESSFPNPNNAVAAPSPLHNEVSAPEAAATGEENPNAKKRATTYSMFDPEDAYGGI